MTQSKNIKRWIDRINNSTSSDSVIIDALMKIRPLSKRHSGIKDIEQHEGIQCFLKLVQRPNRRILDVAISILANCSTEDFVRKKIAECQGIPAIVKVLQMIKHPTIITRTCRSIANLANNLECSKTIHGIGTVDLILKLIKNPSTTPECKSSALRAVKNLANTTNHRKKLIQHNAVTVLTKCFNSDSKEIVSSSIRALAAISQSCTIEFADHMLGNDGESIRKLVEVIKNADGSKSDALSILINLTLQGCARPILGNVGGLECVVDEIKNILGVSENVANHVQGPLQEHSFRLVGALCYCCREAINRARLRSLDALPLFIKLLSDDRWINVHNFILTSLLCFVYDEVGLKALHDSGIFTVLLSKLKEYTLQEQKIFSETQHQTPNLKQAEMVWDGHDIDNGEKFDRRHSLSCDVPTKFNQRPIQIDDENDIEATFKTLTEFELEWRLKFDSNPCSPQWSPLGPSPAPEDFAEESTPPDTPNIPRSISPELMADDSHHIVPELEEESELLLDQDESSSSRDGFDQMHSPALLPVANPLNLDSADTSIAEKRNRHSSSSSNGSSSEEFSLQTNEIKEFKYRMEKDLRQVSKRAKIDNLKESDRIRSRSLDTGECPTSSTAAVDIPSSTRGPCSPSPEFTLPDLGNTACSPSFLQFVNDTCSVSPHVLKHAGRDVSTSASSTSSSTSASSWKQNRRKKSAGPVRRLDELDSGSTQENTQEITQPKHPTTSTNQIPSELAKTMSNPLPKVEEKPAVADHSNDCALVGPEPVTPIQVILCLLCHYCEMSDVYVTSLAQQENCTECFITYITQYPGKLNSKFVSFGSSWTQTRVLLTLPPVLLKELNRIIDRLTSCPDCFYKIVSTLLISSVDAATNRRTIEKDKMDDRINSEVVCKKCDIKVTLECNNLLDNMWHNISLSHSSVYGANSLKRMITKGTDSDGLAATSVIILLSLWYCKSEDRMKNMSDSLIKYIVSNLQLILDHKKLHLIFEAIVKRDISSVLFQSSSFTFHKLAGQVFRHLSTEQSAGVSKNESPDLFEITPSDNEWTKSTENDLMTLFDVSTGGKKKQTKEFCKYTLHCAEVEPDKILVFSCNSAQQQTEIHRHHHNTRARKTSKMKKSSQKPVNSIPVHSDILSNKSHMFEAMLGGKYRESAEKRVNIQDISYYAGLYIIHNIYECKDDNCRIMRNVLSNVQAAASANSRYEDFRDFYSKTQQKLPVEIEILKVSDFWLLPNIRIEFYEKYTNFMKYYMEKEISYLRKMSDRAKESVDHLQKKKQLRATEVSCESIRAKSTGSLKFRTAKYSRSAPFLHFVTNHGFLDITHNFVNNHLFHICSFGHDHVCHGIALALIASDSESITKTLLEELGDILRNIIEMFKNIRVVC